MKDNYEAIVIGGGPAGATCATVLAQHDRDVLLLEKATFPRFKIGESLMPMTYGAFKRIGVWDALKRSSFVEKRSVQFVSASGKESQPFYFEQTHPHESSTTWQVLRSEFDKLMIENARDKGVDAREGQAVKDVLFDGARAVGVRVKLPDGSTAEVVARIVVDATGTSAMLSRKLDIRRSDPMLRKASIFAHYNGAKRDSGIDDGANIIMHLENAKGWFWFIPLPDDVASIGVVAEPEYLFKNRARDPARTLDEEIGRCPRIAGRLEGATRTSDVHVLKDFSYTATQCAGDGWVLIGDAFGFLDPVYSSGVFLALESGQRAADAIHAALESGDLSGKALGVWGEAFYEGMQAVRKLVYAFYDDNFSFGKFMRAHPEQAKNLVGVLIGDIYTPETMDVFEPMSKMSDLPEPLTLGEAGSIVPPDRTGTQSA